MGSLKGEKASSRESQHTMTHRWYTILNNLGWNESDPLNRHWARKIGVCTDIVGQLQKSHAGKEHEGFWERAGALAWLGHGEGWQAAGAGMWMGGDGQVGSQRELTSLGIKSDHSLPASGKGLRHLSAANERRFSFCLWILPWFITWVIKFFSFQRFLDPTVKSFPCLLGSFQN